MSSVFHLQVSLFGDYKNLDLEKKNVFELYQEVMSQGLMPSAMKEFDVIKQELKNRPFFFFQDNSYSISIGSGRIDISSDSSAGGKMPSVDLFFEKANLFAKILYEKLEIPTNRVSFICETVVKRVDTASDALMEGQKYLNLDHAVNKDTVFEWSANTVTNAVWPLCDLSENININVTIALRNMIRVENGKQFFIPSIVLTQDINTKGENATFRFGKEHVEAFLEKARATRTEIEEKVVGE